MVQRRSLWGIGALCVIRIAADGELGCDYVGVNVLVAPILLLARKSRILAVSGARWSQPETSAKGV
jgi:hypothetical protein